MSIALTQLFFLKVLLVFSILIYGDEKKSVSSLESWKKTGFQQSVIQFGCFDFCFEAFKRIQKDAILVTPYVNVLKQGSKGDKGVGMKKDNWPKIKISARFFQYFGWLPMIKLIV